MPDTGSVAWVIIGAFAGSVIFVISATEYDLWPRIALFTSSIFIGIFSAKCIATIVTVYLDTYVGFHILIPEPLGAAIASVGAVRVLMYLGELPKNSGVFLAKIKKGKKNDKS